MKDRKNCCRDGRGLWGGFLWVLGLVCVLVIPEAWGHLVYLLQKTPVEIQSPEDYDRLSPHSRFSLTADLRVQPVAVFDLEGETFHFAVLEGSRDRLWVLLPGMDSPDVIEPPLTGRVMGMNLWGELDIGGGIPLPPFDAREQFRKKGRELPQDWLLLVPGWRATAETYWRMMLGFIGLVVFFNFINRMIRWGQGCRLILKE